MGRTGFEVSVVSVGTWPGEPTRAPSRRAKNPELELSATISDEALDIALRRGVNLVMTSTAHGFGHAECLVGDVLYRHSSALVAVTVGRVLGPAGWAFDYQRDSLIRACELSLTRLGRGVIDVLLLDSLSPSDAARDLAIEAAYSCRTRGLARHVGFSSTSVRAAKKLIETDAFDVASVEMDPIDQRARELFPLAGAYDVGLLVTSSLTFGALSDVPAALSTEAWLREWFPELDPAMGDAVRESVRRLRSLALESRRGAAELAIHFALDETSVTSTVVGARSVRQVVANLHAPLTEPLNGALLARVGDVELAVIKRLRGITSPQ